MSDHSAKFGAGKWIWLIASLSIPGAFAQVGDLDPLFGRYELGGSAELVLFLADNTNQSQRIVDLEPGTQRPRPSPRRDQPWLGGGGRPLLATGTSGDFDGDLVDEYVGVFQREDAGNQFGLHPVFIVVPALGENLSVDAELVEPASVAREGAVRVVAGHFTGGRSEEILLAVNQSSSGDQEIRLRIYGIDNDVGKLAATIIASWEDSLGRGSSLFDVTVADVNGDGDDEIVLAAVRESELGITTYVDLWFFDVMNEDIVEVEELRLSGFPLGHHAASDCGGIRIASGEFNGDTVRDLILAVHCRNNSVHWIYESVFLIGDGFLDFLVFNTEVLRADVSTYEFPFDIAPADLNQDGKTELLHLVGKKLLVCSVREGQTVCPDLSEGAIVGSELADYNQPVLVVADTDASDSTSWVPEVFVVSQHDESIWLQVFVPSENSPSGLRETRAAVIESGVGSEIIPYSIVAGDLDSDAVRLGHPRRYVVTRGFPLVVLNAPPTHFDILDSGGTPTTYDIANCYSGQRCGFQSSYSAMNERSSSYELVVNADWSVGGSLSGDLGIPFIKVVEGSLSASYGRRFSKSSRYATTLTERLVIKASTDDQIHARTWDYDIWEYPVMAEGETHAHVAVVVPKPVATREWFEAKSERGNFVLLDHEVGNVLSYPREISDNLAVDKLVWEGPGVQVGSEPPGLWELVEQAGREVSDTHSTTFSVEGNISFDVPFSLVPGIQLTGDYSKTSVSTQTLTFGASRGLTFEWSDIDLSGLPTRYSIRPYVYFAKSGAVVFDYTTKPQEPAFNEAPTFWSHHYGQVSDPTFVLPWRFDPEKNRGTDEGKRDRTRDIVFVQSKADPSAYSIVARIKNHSLVPTPDKVKVRFFAGHPDTGTWIGEAETEGPIGPQGARIVSLTWKPNFDPDQQAIRIYGVVDPDNLISEVHEDNNVAWTIFGSGPLTTDDEPIPKPTTTSLDNNYPNPFSQSTRIPFTLSASSEAEITVFDLLGRKVRVIKLGKRPSGSHEIHLEATSLPSGVYFYRLEAADFVGTKRMVVVK